MASQIEKSFKPLRDLPCWGVKRGYGTFLTLEFGEPRLVIREPIASASGTVKVRRMLARRLAYVAGEWHLWIYQCMWAVYNGATCVGDWSSPRRIDKAAQFLNGQKLSGVDVSTRGSKTRFSFDLGAVLLTQPYNRTAEQWLLYEPNGNVLILKAGGWFSYGPGKTSTDHWRKVAG